MGNKLIIRRLVRVLFVVGTAAILCMSPIIKTTAFEAVLSGEETTDNKTTEDGVIIIMDEDAPLAAKPEQNSYKLMFWVCVAVASGEVATELRLRRKKAK